MGPEGVGANSGEIRDQAKEQARVQVTEADTAAKKQTLGGSIVRKLREIKQRAQEFITAVTENQFGQRELTDEDVEKGNRVLHTLIEAAETAKNTDIPVSNTREGQAILAKLADKNLDTTNASTIEIVLGDYLVGDQSIVVGSPAGLNPRFIEAFNLLKRADPRSARMLREAIVEARNSAMPGIPEDEIKRVLSLDGDGDQRNSYGKRGPTSDEWRRYEQINQDIENALRRGPDDRNITGNERGMVENFRFNDSSVNEDRLGEVFDRLGIDRSKISEYKSLREKLFSGLDIEFIKNYMPEYSRYVDQAQQDFDLKNLKEKFLRQENGRWVFDKNKRHEFQELIQKYYYYALDRIHNDKSKLFDKSMGQSVEYQYYFGAIRQIIGNACEQLKKYHFQNDTDIQDFLTDKSSRYQATIMTLAQTFHDIPLYARDAASFEKWPDFLGYLFPSELAEVFDEGDRFMQITRDEISMYIRKRLVQNNNIYPADLFSGEYKEEGVRWSLKFEEDLRDALRKKAERLGINLTGENEWKLKRAITYASGIGISNLVDIEVAGTAEAGKGFEGIHPLMSKLIARHNWGMGRGDPFAGVIAKYLLRLDADLFPKDRNFFARIWRKKRWVPNEFADLVDSNVKKYGEKTLEVLFDRGGSYQELMSMLNIASSLIGRHGWRMRPIKDELSGKFKLELGFELGDSWKNFTDPADLSKNWNAERWRKLFDMSLGEYGNGSLWWFLASGPERVEMEVKRLIAKELGDDKAYELFNDPKQKYGEALKKEFEYEIWGKKQKMSFLELRNLRHNQLRGETFFRYLRRNPGDFYLLLSQLVPELNSDSDGFVFMDEASLESGLRSKGKTRVEIEQIKARRTQLIKRWGDQFETLKKVNKWVRDKVGPNKRFSNTKQFIDVVSVESGAAFEKMMQQNIPIMQRIQEIEFDKGKLKGTLTDAEKREVAELRTRLRLYLKKEDFGREGVGRDVGDILYDQNGLFRILTGQDGNNSDAMNNFMTNFGDFEKSGTRNFFYEMANSWTFRQGDINPFSSDFNHYAVYKHLGEVGEDAPKRWLGDANAVAKMIEGVGHLDKVLREASKEGNFEELYKIHESMFDTLKNIISDEYAWRANYILASIVTKYFLEHDLSRNIILRWLGLVVPTRWLLGWKRLSLSKILWHNRHAYSIDENGARAYFRKLQEMDVIPREGIWSVDHLDKQFDASTKEYVFGDALPTFLWFMFLFLTYSYMRKAMEESEGKKN